MERVADAVMIGSRGSEVVRLIVTAEHLAAYVAGRSPFGRLLLRLDRPFGEGIKLPTPLDVDERTLAAWLSEEAAVRPGPP